VQVHTQTHIAKYVHYTANLTTVQILKSAVVEYGI